MKTILVGCALALVLATGCKQKIDHEKGEKAIKEGLEQRGLKMASLSCPADVPVREGQIFICNGKTTAAEDVVVTVSQTDNKGNVQWKLDGMIVEEKKLQENLTEQLKAPTTLSCPKKLVQANASVICDVTTGGETKKVTITAAADGSVAWKINP